MEDASWSRVRCGYFKIDILLYIWQLTIDWVGMPSVFFRSWSLSQCSVCYCLPNLRPSSAATRLPSSDLKLNYVIVCALCVQDGSVLKMIVDWASLDTGLGARALAQVIESEIAELEQEEEWEGRQRTRASSRGKAAASPLPTPRPRAARRRKISVRRPDTP